MNHIADARRVIEWARTKPRKLAHHAFTEGAERQAAYWVEWTETEMNAKIEKLQHALHIRRSCAVCPECNQLLDSGHAEDCSVYKIENGEL